MPSSALQGFALLTSTCTLLLVAAGVFAHGAISPESHRLMGTAVLVLSMVEAAWVVKADERWLTRAGALLLVLSVALLALVPGYPAVHATISQFAFGLSAAVAALASPASRRAPQPVADEGTPSVRTFGWMVPSAVAMQAALGAGLRHEALPVWPHISGSLLVGGLLLFAGMAVMQSYPEHAPLRRAGLHVLVVTGVQVSLGMAAYGVRMMSQPDAWTVWLTAAHVATGALTLGAALVFALQVFTHVESARLVHKEAAV